MYYTAHIFAAEGMPVREKQPLQVDYHVMLAGSPDPVVLLDVDSGMLIDVNSHALTLFGLSEEELLASRLADLCPPLQPDGTPSSEFLTNCIRIIESGQVRGFSIVFLQGGLRQVSTEVRLVPLPVSGRKLFHFRIVDVTRRDKEELLRVGQGRVLEMVARGAPLAATLDELMLLIEGQSEGLYCSVLLLDEDGISVRPVSGPSLPASFMAALDGWRIGPEAGSCGTAMFTKKAVIVSDIRTDPKWQRYLHLAEPYGIRACWSTPIYLDREHVLGSFAMYYKEVRIPTADDMRLVAVATHLAGIAIERTRRERELVQHREHLEVLVAARTAELTAALETLSLTQEELVRRDKLAALGTLVAGVAHELNTPIGNSLVVATTMAEHARTLEGNVAQGLRRSRLEGYLEQAHEASDILIRNLHRAASLVASFKQLAVDTTTSQRRKFSLGEMLTELAATLRIAIRERPIEVVLQVEAGLVMDSFPGPLSQVVSSLFDNCLVHAFEADEAGTITLGARARGPGQIALSIADTGAGMAPELAARVYDPFFTTKLGSGGSGLGLHVAHNIVTGVLGGKIELESAPGQGSTFTLVLPVSAPGFVKLS